MAMVMEVRSLRLLKPIHSLCAPRSSARVAADPAPLANPYQRFFEDFGVWKDSPVLKGSTKFDPLPGVKNIMITGGAGFMYASLPF